MGSEHGRKKSNIYARIEALQRLLISFTSFHEIHHLELMSSVQAKTLVVAMGESRFVVDSVGAVEWKLWMVLEQMEM